ncbi:NUDIX hydrolase [Streptomyces himalayensis]|uniref:NUDIX hydrolase n=1 Tax=Streptomyces himalayensis subsp. himalayensis TaxID=2756131 RepID=A0A7W0DLK1_9ACTN|nr:NUDIX hydrolase [Streptomyces himalayensis]MBA2947317.1 NUDIX hydrolase [Streptomyces himalayensis subsp. himalayensis]
MSNDVVQAAGCVLWRRSPSDGEPEICLVHRPKYDDWSHPKGKVKRGEDLAACAVREVAEETGHECTLGPRLATVRYIANGRPKQVSYWAAEAGPGHFTPTEEVDQLLWLPPQQARPHLTQPRDQQLLDDLLSALHLT